MWMMTLLPLLRMASILTAATPTVTWQTGQDLLKNQTLTHSNMWECLVTPAILDTNFRYKNLPTARLKGSLHNIHGGSVAHVSISPVPCERPLLFTFFAYTQAKNQKLTMMVEAEAEGCKIVRTFVDGPQGSFGGLGCFGQLVALPPGAWIKIEKTYIVPKGTQTLHISVSNIDPQDIHIAKARLIVGESVLTTSRRNPVVTAK